VNLFTIGQKQRMLAYFNPGGPRNAILQSKGLSEPWNFTKPEVSAEALLPNSIIQLYPNPAGREIILNFQQEQNWIGKTISIVNLNGVVMSRVQVKSLQQKLDLTALRPGMYFVQGDNGEKKVRQKFIRL
jgi:hypothetical protein